MQILITAGGTIEKIDHVRSIGNHSTGALGKALAEVFLQNGANVTYVTTAAALKPQHPNCQLHLIETSHDLAETLQQLLMKQPFDAVIHSMAVSDYTVSATFPAQLLAQNLAEKTFEKLQHSTALDKFQWETFFQEQLQNLPPSPTTGKLSSQHENLWLKMTKTPKIIQQIKQLQPETLLVGFKLLVAVSPTELFRVATKLLEKNHCDFVLANDLTEITPQSHHGYLLDKQGGIVEAYTKNSIAQLVFTSVTAEIERRK